jgi:ketosteroid isomerase-like protein
MAAAAAGREHCLMSASVTDDALQRWFTALYAAFNARDVPALLAAMAPDVIWPNGWEGGIVRGRDAVRDYWKRQWSQINPIVTPTVVEREADGRIAVRVHQIVRDGEGNTVTDGQVTHVYRLRDGLVQDMEIRD